MNKIIRNKMDLKLVTSPESPKQVQKSGFRVIPKITSVNLCKLVYDIINYPTLIYPIESGKCEKKKKKITKKSFLFRLNNKSFT